MATTPATRLADPLHLADTATGHTAKGQNTPSNRAPLVPRERESLSSREEFVQHTISVWQRFAGRKLLAEDARVIAKNVAGFFDVLQDWSVLQPSPELQSGEGGERREANK